MEGLADGVGAVIEALVGGEGIGDEGDAFLGGLGAEGGKELGGERAFEWDEAEDVLGVVAEEEADDSVAENADAVVEEDGVGLELGAFGVGHFASLRGFVGVASVTFILDG